MTVEKAETDKDSLVGEESNPSLMIPPPSANLPKVLVMGDEVKGIEGDQPQERKEELVAKEEKKPMVDVTTSTNDSDSKTAKSHAECDTPVASETEKPETKLIDNISLKPPKVESAAPSSEASPTCEGGIVPAKDCDALGSDKVGKKIAILQSEATQKSANLPLPVVKNVDKSSSSSDKSSLDISVPLVGKSVEKTSVMSESMDTKGSKHEKGGVQLKMVSRRDSPGVLKEIDHKADLNSHKATEVISKGKDKELFSKDKKSVAGETKKTLESASHDKSVEQPELKKSLVDCQSHSKIKKDEESGSKTIQATGDKGVQKSACLEQKSVTKCSKPENRGIFHSDEKLKAIETATILTKEDIKPAITGIHVSEKKDLSVSEENKISDKHKDTRVQAEVTGDKVVKVEEKVVVEETVKLPEKVSLTNSNREPDSMKESKRSQQTNLVSVPIVSSSIAGAENQSMSVKTDSKMSFSPIKSCEPELEILSKSDKNDLVVSDNSTNRTNSPSQVQISDEKLKFVDEAPKCGNLDNNDKCSLPDGRVIKEKSLRQSEPDSSECSGVNVVSMCCKDSNDLKMVAKTDEVATMVESKPFFSVSSSSLAKSVLENTTKITVDSVNKEEIPEKSVESSKTTIRKNLEAIEEVIDNSSTLGNVHSSKNSQTCDSVPVREELLGVVVKSGGPVFQGNPLLNPVKVECLKLPSASIEFQDLKPSPMVTGASEGASQDYRKLDVDDIASMETSCAKDEKDVPSACYKTPLNQPTQVLNVALEAKCSGKTKSVMKITDKEILNVSSKVKVVPETMIKKCNATKSPIASEPNKVTTNNDVSKYDDKATSVSSTSKEKVPPQIGPLQAKDGGCSLKDVDVTPLKTEQEKAEEKQNQPNIMPTSSIQDTSKESPDSNLDLGKSSLEKTVDAISINSVPDIKEISDKLTENEDSALAKSKAVVASLVKEDEPDLISKPIKSDSLPKSWKLPSTPIDENEAKKQIISEKIATKNIPLASKTEVDKVEIVSPPNVGADKETPKSTEIKIMGKSHSMDAILSKSVSLPHLEKIEVGPEKACALINIPPVSAVDISEVGKSIARGQEKLDEDHLHVNCSERPGTSKLVNFTNQDEGNSKQIEKSSMEKVLPEVVPSSKGKQEAKVNSEKGSSSMELATSMPLIESSKVIKESESNNSYSSASKSKEEPNTSKITTTIVNRDSTIKVEKKDKVNLFTDKAEGKLSSEPKNSKRPLDSSSKDEPSTSASSNANSFGGSTTEIKLEIAGACASDQQNMFDGIELTPSVLISSGVSQDNTLSEIKIDGPITNPFPDLLNVAKQALTSKNSNDSLEMCQKVNIVEPVGSNVKALVKDIELAKSAQKVDEVSNNPSEKNISKENVNEGTKGEQLGVKDESDKLCGVESHIKSSSDQKPLGEQDNSILPPNQDSKMKTLSSSHDIVYSPNTGDSKVENPSAVLNDAEITESSKFKKRGDLKHSREKSILGITEKLAVANQMRQQKQGSSEAALKESSSPKKMPGLIEMGVAKASRRKNLVVKDDQRMFKKTKVVTIQDNTDAGTSRDLIQSPSKQGVEITLGKSEITLGMGQSLNEVVRNTPNPQPEVVIAAELPVTEKSQSPKKDGVGLDSCTIIDLSSKCMDPPKENQAAKVSDGLINISDRPSPSTVEKLGTEAESVKEHDNNECFEVDKGSLEDQKDTGSFKFPRVKRNSGKEKVSCQSHVVSPSVAGPTTRTRANFKPPSSPVKSIPKVEDPKENTYPKTIKGLAKRDDKTIDIEVKRKSVEVSTEPFSKPLDAESKRVDYAEEALSIRAINSPSAGSSSKLLEVIRVAEEKGKDIVKVNDVEVMREPVGSNTAPMSLMRKHPSSSPLFSSISVSTEGQRKDSIPQETKNTMECAQADGSSVMCKFPSGNTESWEFVAKVGEVELLRESPRVTPKPTPPPVTITMEPVLKKPSREKPDSGSRKPGRPSSMPPPSKTPDYPVTPLNMLEQAFMAPQNIRNHSLEVLVGIGNRPGDGNTIDTRAQVSPMAMQMGNSSLPHWTLPNDTHSRTTGKTTVMETYLSGKKTPVGEQVPESDTEKRKKGSSKARNAPPPRWSSQEADMLSVKVDGHSLGTWSPGDWRSLPSVHMWPPGYSGYGPPLRPRGPLEPRCSRSVSPPSHSGRRGGEHMPEDLSSPPLPRGRRESPHSFRHPFVHPATSFPGAPSFSNVSVMSYTMPKNNSALNLAKSTATATPPSDTAMNLTMCRQSPSTPTPPPLISSPGVQQPPRQSFPVNLVKSRSSSPKAPAQQAQSTLPDGRGAVLPGGIVVPNLPLIFGREYAVGSPSTPPSGRISHCSAEESRETGESVVGQVVRCSSEPPRDHMAERRPRESPIMTGFVPTGVPPRTSAACQTNQSIQSFPVPRPSSAMSSLEQVSTSGVSRSTITEPNLLPGGVVIPNLYGPNGFRPGEEQWNSSGGEVGRLDLPPRSLSSMSQHHPDESPSKQVTARMPTPIPTVSTTPIPPSSTPPPAPPQKTGPGRRGGRAETPPPDKYNFRIEEAHVVMSGGGHGGAGGKLFACDICSGVYRRAFSLKRHYLRAHINYCHLSERDLSNCGIVVGDRMAVHSGGSGRRPYVHTTLPRSTSKSPEEEPERGSGRRTHLRDLFRCHTCGVCFDEKRRLKAHLMEHQCGSNRPSLLRQHHATAHHVVPPTVAPRPAPTPRPHPSSPTPTVYLCAYCDKRFSSAAVRRRHRKLHESSPGPHPCYLCETAEDTPDMPLGETPSFAHLEDLRSHMASIHKEVYHSCALCGERLPTILALEEHAEEHRSRRQATEQSDEEEEEEDVELVRAAAAAPSTESPRRSEGVQSAAPSQGDEEEFRYTCGVCQKMFTNYVNMCRHRRLAHGAAQTKVVGRKAGAASTGKGQAGGRDSESSSRSQSPVVVSQSSERGHRDLLDGEPSSSSSSVPSPCPYPSSTAASANDPETIFYTRLAGNIRENLLNYLDGKLHKQNSSDKQSKEDFKGAGYEKEGDEEVKLEPTWEKYNFPKDFQQMSYWDISTQLVVRNNLRKVSCLPSVEPDPEQRPAFPETLALVETSKSGEQANKEESGLKNELEEEVAEGEWSGLSGEWVRPRSYICCACASRFCDLWAIEDHKLARHPNVWCTHLEVEDGAVVLPGSPKLSPGSANVAVSFLGDLLCRRPLGPRGALLSAPSVPPTLNSGMESPSARCTKCSRVCPSLPDLHSHMLECGGDIAWAAWAGGSSPAASSRRNSRKWRPFGSRRRRQRGRRGMKRNIPSSPVKMHRARHRGTDSDSIQRMIANLPAKRATRRVIQFNEDEIKTRSQATIHSVSFTGNFVRVSGYKAPLGVKGTPPTAAKRGRPPKNPLPPTPLNIEGMAVPSTSMAMPPMGISSANAAASGTSPQGVVKKGRGRPPGSKSRTSTSNSDFTLKRRFGESMGEGYSPEGDRYAISKRSRPGVSPVNQHPVSSAAPSVPGEPYVCKGCGAVFDNASSCERHGKKCVFRRQMPIMPSSDGIRPTPSGSVRPVHACPHCGKNFTYATPMEKHVRVCGSSIPRGLPVPLRRATAPSVLGRPPKAEEDEVKKDSEIQEESLPPSEEAESPQEPSEPTQEPDMPQLQKEEPVASPPIKDDDIPVLTPVEPEEEEAVKNVEEVVATDIKEDILPDEPEIKVPIPSEVEVVVSDESETLASTKEGEDDMKPLDEPVLEVKEEVVELPEETPAEENLPTPTEPEEILPEVPMEDVPTEDTPKEDTSNEDTTKETPAEEVTTEMEEREESPESEETTLRTTGKRTRGSSSSGQVAKKNKMEEEAEEPVAEVDTPKKKGGKKSLPVSTRGKSPKGLRTTRGTKGEDEVTSEGEDKKEKEDLVIEDIKVEEQEDEDEEKVEQSPVQVDKETDQRKGKETLKASDEPETLPIDKEEDTEKEDTSMSEGRGKRGRRAKYSAKPSSATNEVATKTTPERVDSTALTPRQGKRKGSSLERPSSPKVEETPAVVTPEVEPKVTRGSATSQSKVAHPKERDISKEDKGRLSGSKNKEEEEVTVSTKEEKSIDVENIDEESSVSTKEIEEDKDEDTSEVKPEAKESGTKAEDSEEEEEDDGGEDKEKEERDSKLRGTKGSKGKVTKKSHKKKKKQELKREVENFWCNVCEMGYSSAFNLVKHGQSQKHKWNQKLAKEKADSAAKESKEGDKSEDKKGDDEGDESGEVKEHEVGKKGTISEGKESDKASVEGRESEKVNAPKCSEGGKGDNEKKVDGDGKSSKKRNDVEVKEKSVSEEALTDKEEMLSKEKNEEDEDAAKAEASGRIGVPDKKGKNVILEDEIITKGCSVKEKLPEKKSPEKKSQERKSEKKLPDKKSPEKKLLEKKSPEKNLQEKNLQEKNLQEKNLQEKNLQEKNLQEKNLLEKKGSEKKSLEKKLPEKKTTERKSQEKKSPDKKSPEKKSTEKKPQDAEIKESDSDQDSLKNDDKTAVPSTSKSKENITSQDEETQGPSKEDILKKDAVLPQTAMEKCTNANLLTAPDDQEGTKKSPTKNVTDGSLIGQTANERGVSGQGDNQPAPAQEAEGNITKVSPEATVAAAPESATVIEGTKNASETVQCGIWPEAPSATPSQEFVQPPAPPPATYNMLYEWNTGMVHQAPMQQAPPPQPTPLPSQQSNITTHMHSVQQDSWGAYGGWEAPITDPNPPPSPGLWRYQPPNPIPWTEPQHSLSPIPRVPSYEDPPPVTHPSTPNPSPPNPSLGSILDSVNRILGEDVPGFDSSRIQAGATAPEEEYGGVGLFGGEGLAELQRAMGATDEEMAMLQQLGTGPLDFVYDNNAITANVAYNAAESNDQTGPLPNAELVDLDNQSAAVTIAGDGPIEEAESTALPPVAADSSSYFMDGRGGKRRRCGPPPSKCKKIVPPPRESNRGWRGGRRLLPTQASLASAHLLISQYEKKEMVCPMCNRHFLGLAALETHVAWVHKVKDAKQHILEGTTDGQPSGKKPNPAATNTLRELVAGRAVGGVVVGGGVTSSPTPSRRLPCFVCKELYSDVISLNHHIAQQHLRRRAGEGGAVPEMDGNLKSQMTSALGGLLGKALANMRSRSDANMSLQKPGLPATSNKSPLFSTFPKLNLLTKSLDAINKMSSTDGSSRKSFGGPSSSEGTSENYSRADASSDSPEVALFRREDGLDPSEWSSDGEDSSKGQEAEGQLDEGEIPSFHHICPFCGYRFQKLSSRNRHITWAHRDMTCMDTRIPRSCSHESSDFDDLIGRGRRDEMGDGGSMAKEESEESQETGRRHNHHPCPACQLTFLRHSQLEAHLKRAHNGIDSPLPDNPDSMMECPICRESMNNFLKLCKHVKTKHREWSINCFTTDMHHHLILRKESPEESMVIRKKFLVKMKAFPVLRMASPTPSSRSSEEESYMDPDPKGNYLCSVCGVNFKSPQGVIRHLNLEHNANHLDGALPTQKIFPRHATKEYRSRSGGGLGSDIKAKAEAALRELNLSQKLKLGAVTSTKGMLASKLGQSKKPSLSTLDSCNDPSIATTSKGSGRGRGSSRRGRGKRGGSRGGMSSDVEKSLFDVYEFEDDDDELEETPSRVGSADGSSRVGSECGDDDEDEDGAEDDGKSGIGSAASIRGKRGSVDSSSSDAKYSCNTCGKGYKSLTAFWKHTKGVRGACAGGGSSPGRSGERGSQEGSTGPSVRCGSKASGGRKGGIGKEEEEAVSSDVESEVGGSVRVLRRLRGSTSGASDIGGADGSTETLHSLEASEAAPKRGDKGGGRGGKGKRKGGNAEEEKKSLFSGGETVRTYGGKRSAKQQAEERRGRGGGGGDDGDSVGGSRRSLGASEAAFDALRGGGSS